MLVDPNPPLVLLSSLPNNTTFEFDGQYLLTVTGIPVNPGEVGVVNLSAANAGVLQGSELVTPVPLKAVHV